MIPSGVITPMTRAVLTNAVYFKGAWVFPFNPEKTTDSRFTLADGSQVRVPMMRSVTGRSRIIRYAEGDGYTAVEIPYKVVSWQDRGMVSHGVAMVVLLPVTFSGVDVLGDRVTPEMLDGLFSRKSWREVDLEVPKFRSEATLMLNGALKQMGVRRAFEQGAADLSGIAGEAGDLYVSGAIQKTFIDVDEKGTEAAAATGVVVGGLSESVAPPVTFYVDRPFLFILREQSTGAILFIGRVLDPR
jgi:serpin B